MNTSTKQSHKMKPKDIAQMAMGAGALALPIAMSEDTWDIAKNLPVINVIGMVVVALLLIAVFVYASYFQGHLRENWQHFLGRVLGVFGVTLIVSSASLTLVDQAHWLTDFYLAFKQTVVVALPASFAAAIVDNLS